MRKQRTPRARAYIQADYDSEKGRFHWIIIVNDQHQSVQVARSIQTFPTEHDANVAGDRVRRQIVFASE